MYLKSLELTGFKSFANKTVVEFNQGITSIVGPNGSGKSNILDAILWVLGEQSYKNIRAKESVDVIFSGGKNKKPKSMAEVSLIIDNEDRYLNLDFSEIQITRRIFRSGENEYLINSRKVRLKDINSLFMDTGIGKQAYSIIGQGRVERIISSNPKELKEIIEEAAGVKRAKHEKEESLKKLREIKNEIEKIDYLEKDLEGRVSSLKEESLKARLYKTYTEKIETAKMMIYEYSIDEKNRLQKEYSTEREELENEIGKIQDDFRSRQDELEKCNETRGKSYRELEDRKERNSETLKLIEKLRDDLNSLNNRLSNMETEAREKESRKKALEEDISEKEKNLESYRNDLDGILKEFELKLNEKKELESKVAELKLKRDKLTVLLKEKTDSNQNLEVNKIRILHENEELEKRIFTTENENKRLGLEFEKIKSEFDRTVSEKEKLDGEREKREREKKDRQNVMLEIDEISGKLEKKYSAMSREKNELSYKYENLLSRKRANENIIENNETFARSIKFILNQKMEGVIGAFINLIDIPEGYEQSFQVLSGSSFQDIVVKDTETGKKCISILKEKKLGRASFLPADSVKVFKLLDRVPDEKGVAGFARNIVTYDKSVEKIVQFVYGNSLIVENMETGIRLLKKGFNDRIVTLDGDIISARGRMTGGYIQKGKDELLARKQELKEIRETIREVKKKAEKLNDEFAAVQKQMEENSLKKAESTEKFNAFSQEYAEFLKGYENFNLEFSKKRRDRETLEYEINDNEKFLASRKEKIEENQAVIGKIGMDIEEGSKEIERLNKKIEELQDLSEYERQLTAIETEYEILKIKTDSNKTRYSEIEKDYLKLIDERNTISDFEEKRDRFISEHSGEIEKRKKEISLKEEENIELSRQIKEDEKNIRELEKLEKDLIVSVKDIEVKMVEYRNRNEKLIEKMTKNEKNLEFFMEELNRITGLDLRNNEEYRKIQDENEFSIVKRKLEMNEKSRNEIGAVNLSSIEEYERENERYTEIVEQKRDLIKSDAALMNLIKNIETEIAEKFSNAFNEINRNFEYMCSTILNGAKGLLKMTDEENILETGLELSVKYKNKAEQTLLLLSGGEKSMLAVSFIMAIFMFKPSPFTFFDEIEAALDESNTKKIVELLNKFIEKSQFILITHNKETMKGSHRLYGVTMNKEIGESRLVSVDI